MALSCLSAMAAFDGGDGSGRTGDPEEAAPSVASAAEVHSQVSASSNVEHEGEESETKKRGCSNSTSGRWDSTASWGERDYHWESDRHWDDQWRRSDWRGWNAGWKRSWFGHDRYWEEDDYESDDEDDWGPDPWAAAWRQKQEATTGGKTGKRRDPHRGADRRDEERAPEADGRAERRPRRDLPERERGPEADGRAEGRPGHDRLQRERGPEADGRAERRRGPDQPDRGRDSATVWSGWKHFAGNDWSESTSHDGSDGWQASRARPSEKLTVPSFSGEDTDDVGTSARSYLRQVEAWKSMTLLPAHQQGLVLYQHLSGKAWVAAEELSVDSLATDDGVQYLVRWITNRYLDLEVTRIGKAFSEFFRRLRRKPGQSIRDYNSEYDRLHARLREVGCNLPEDCAAWLYVDRLQLEEPAELNLLASVGNTYSLPRLQQAAVIHDRGHRKPWESGGPGKGRRTHTAHFTEADDGFGSGEEDGDHYEEDDGIPEEVAVAYATYQTAKQRYKEHQKARGFNSGGHDNRAEATVNGKNNEKATDKIKLMKAKSFCSGCGRRGHWHKDPECPHNQGSQMQGGGKAAEVGFCNLLPAEVFSIKHENTGLVGITDTACARTVAGTQWLQAYSDKLSTLGGRPELRKECEAYRFGTGKIYYSSFYVVLAFELGNKVVHVRTSIINGDVPLLLSETVLGKLGMVFDIERGQADFSKVGLKGFDLLVTSSGHPAIPIIPSKMDGDPSMFRAEDLKLVPKCEYMAFAVAHGSGHVKNPDIYNFFYDKKLDPGVKAMLVQEKLSQEEFIAWWRSSSGSSDFWLECDNAWVRVHVTPRKALFNPSTWKTRATVQKEMLVQTAGEIRITDGVCCTTGRWLESVVDRWEHDKIYEPAFAFHWVGRTWISKRQSPSLPQHAFDYGARTMQASPHQPHDEDTASRGSRALGRSGPSLLECDRDQGRDHGSARGPEGEGPHRADEENFAHDAVRAAHEGERARHRLQQQHDQRQSSPPDKRQSQHPRSRTDEVREISGISVLRDSEELRRVGPQGDVHLGEPRPGVREVRTVVQAEADREREPGVREQGHPATVSELDGGHPEDKPNLLGVGQGLLGHGDGQGQCILDNQYEKENAPRHRGGQEDGLRDRSQGGGGDRGFGDKAGSPEGQGPRCKGEVNEQVPRGRVEDVGHGEEKGKVLTARPQGGEHPVVHGFGGRKCCPELSYDCFFTEEEFSNAYKNRNEICEIDFEGGNRIEVEDNEDVDLFHEAMEGEDDIEVFECKEFSIEDRITFAYDSGDFSFATCKEILDEGCEEALKGGGERKRVFHEASGQVAFGYYVHGGMNGVTKSVVNHTVLARYLNAFIRAHVGEHATRGAVSVIKGGAGKVHHDYNNAAGSTNYFASFGQGPGGKLWVHDDSIIEADIKEDKHGDIVWKQTGSGEWLPGRTVDANEKFVEFDPHTKHQAINVDSEAWRVVAYTPRGTEDAKPDIVKFLKNCGFPLPGRKRGGRAATCAKPSKRQRNSITNVVGKLSVLFTTLLTAANSFLGECIQTGVINDPIVILEIGGLDATLDATELDKAVLEPLSWEDYGDPGTRNRTLHLVKAVTPRHLHLHLEQAPAQVHGDLKELVREQLNGGGAVLLQGGDPGLVVEDTEHYIRYKKNHEGEEWTVLARPGTRSLELPTSLDPHHVLVVSEDSEKKDELPLRIDGSGITFEEGVPGHVRSALKRLHQNLGHPRGADLVRHLRLAGCESSVIKAAKGMKCQICDATKEPQVARPASLPRMLSFGEVVCADILYAHDCEDKRHTFLSLVDVGTTYHVVVKLRNTGGKEVEQAFNTYWLTPFGAPNAVSLDLETGLQDGFSRLCSWHNVKIRNSATQAHFQSGVGERQGKWFKNIWVRVCRELSIAEDEVQLAATSVCCAKNGLRRRCGHSPSAWIFGREARGVEQVLDPDSGGRVTFDISDDARFQRQMAIRASARIAFHKSENDAKLRKSLLQRARATTRPFENGEQVHYWNLPKNRRQGRWEGPAIVVGREGNNYWVSRGGRCRLTAPEHLRPSGPDETGEFLAMGEMKRELEQLLNQDFDGEEVYDGSEGDNDSDVDGIESLYSPSEQRGDGGDDEEHKGEEDCDEEPGAVDDDGDQVLQDLGYPEGEGEDREPPKRGWPHE